MKTIRLLVAILFVLLVTNGFGQSEKAEENPRTALTEARKTYEQALKKKDAPLLIKSIILQIKYQSLIDQDSIPTLLSNLEAYVVTSKNPVEKSILHSLLAELYKSYYISRVFEINGLTPITGYIPEDVKVWTGNIFIEKIFQHIEASLKPTKELIATNSLQYKDILILGKDSREFSPTLYDLLVYRSIKLLSSMSYYVSDFFEQKPLTNDKLFAPADEFVQLSVPEEPYNCDQYIIRLYQSLLQVQLNSGQKNTLLWANLQRLNFVSTHITNENASSLYEKALFELNDEYRNDPLRVEILHTLAQLYLRKNIEQQESPIHKENPESIIKSEMEKEVRKALRLCQEGIRLFPNYFRINILKNLAETLKSSAVNINLLQTVYPGKDQIIHVNYKNTSSIKFELYKLNVKMNDYLTGTSKTYPKEKISTRSYKLPAWLLSYDTTFQIPISRIGLYELIISSQGNTLEKDTLYFSSSRFTGFSRQIEKNTNSLLVCDMESGKPISGATVNIYDSKGDKTYQYIARYRTDKYGMASIPTDYRNTLCFQISSGDDTHGAINYLPSYYSNYQNPTQLSEVNLFTDRAIYRPGQTIYFCGIAWEANKENSKAIAGKEYTVTFHDANNQEIASKRFTSNEFGSFAGSFTIPKDILNGQVSLRTNGARRFVSVAEYQRPKFEITFDPVTGSYQSGDTITVKGKAKTYSGVNLSDCQVSYTLSKSNFYRFNSKRTISNGEVKTDRDGNFQIRFATDTTTQDTPYHRMYNTYYTVSVTITSPNGETQAREFTLRIDKTPYQLSIQLPTRWNKHTPLDVEIVAVNANGNPLAQTVNYSIAKLKPLSSLKESYSINNAIIEKEIFHGVYKTGNNPLHIDLSIYPSGAYLFTAEGSTSNGQKIRRQRIFYLYAPSDKRPPILTYNWLIEEKTTCKPGEEAKITLGSSASDIYVLYEIYDRGQFIERKRFELTDENITLSVPYKADYGKSIQLLITYVKDRQLFYNAVTIERQEPDKQLDIFTKTFRDHLSPGQKEEWSFTIRNKAGQAVLAEFMAGMYDTSLDQFASNRWYFNPVLRYYEITPQWISNALTANIYGYIDFKSKNYKIPEFKFDRLNLFGLNFNQPIVVRGYAAGRAAKTVMRDAVLEENSVTEYDYAGEYSDKAKSNERQVPPVQIRQNLQETAFFYPQLRTDSAGNVSIKFTVPEATTTWRFMALAHTPDMAYGQLEKSVLTNKEFMVSTNLPRFVRTGDQVVLKATVNNLSPSQQQGNIYLELFDPITDKTISRQTQSFNVATDQNQTFSFSFTVPEGFDMLGCKTVASSSLFSDGEQQVIAVVPDEIPVTRTLPIYMIRKGEETFAMNIPKKITPYRLTLEMTANPIWYAVLALPSINTPQTDNVTEITASYYVSTLATAIANANPEITRTIKEWLRKPGNTLTSPLEKNEELKSILLQLTPWVREAQNETGQMHLLGELLDINRQDYIRKQALTQLARLQNSDGGWSWFKGSKSNTFITENVLEAMARLVRTGATELSQEEKTMQIQALKYLDDQIEREYSEKNEYGYSQLLYLYTRSSFRDIPLTNALEAHKHYLSKFKDSWADLSLYEKALVAMTLYRYGETETAKRILHSLKEYATITPEMGMFWANNRSNLFTNSAIQTQVALMSAFHEIEGDSEDTELMKQWLLRQKQTQNWGSTPTTVDAIYALVLTGKEQLSQQDHLTIKLGNKNINVTPEEAKLGYIKKSYTAKEITSKMTKASITKTTDQASWGGLYLQYFEKLDKITSHSGGVSVNKQLFIEETGKNGKTLIPLADQKLRIGNKINVRITVQTGQDMQFVHLKDLRAGCLEPTEQLSGYRWQNGISYYQETTDAAMNFFFEFLPKGTHVFEYTLWVAQDGVYQGGIATLQCIYAPQYSANSKASILKIEE